MSQQFSGVRSTPLRRIIAASAAASAVALTAGALAPASASAASTVCGKTAHCHVVDHADVDGDGHADTIAIAPKKIDKHGYAKSVSVRVKTSKGKLLTRTVKGVSMVPTDHLYRGAAAIDGEKGADLVIGHQFGAHTNWYRVLTEKAGKLKVSAAPKLPGDHVRTKDWVTDGSVNTTLGIDRHKKSGKPATVTFKSGATDVNGSSDRLKGTSTKFRWQHGDWKKVSSTKHSWTPKQAGKISGWHVKGLSSNL